jgi:hypothetical protein
MLQVGEFSWFFNVFSGFLVGALSFLSFQKKLFSALNEKFVTLWNQPGLNLISGTGWFAGLRWTHQIQGAHENTESDQQVELENSTGMGYKPGIPVLQPFGRAS